jgi:hypothetical protein
MLLDPFRIVGGVYRQYNRVVNHVILSNDLENAPFQTVN